MKKELTLRQINNRVDKIWIDENLKCQKDYEVIINEKKSATTRENAKKRLAKRLAEYNLTVENYGRYYNEIMKEFWGE